MISRFLKIKKDMLSHGQEVDFNNKESREHFIKKRKKRNKLGSINSSEKWFKELENKEEEIARGSRQLRVKEKVIQEIKVWRLINLHKKVIKTVKKLHRNKVNKKVKKALAKKRNIFQRKNPVKS